MSGFAHMRTQGVRTPIGVSGVEFRGAEIQKMLILLFQLGYGLYKFLFARFQSLCKIETDQQSYIKLHN